MNAGVAFRIARSVPVLVAGALVGVAPYAYGWAGPQRLAWPGPAEAERAGGARAAPTERYPRDAAHEAKPGSDADHPKSGVPIGDGKLRRLAWGPPAPNGLRAAGYFEPTQDGYADGEMVKRKIVFHNSGNEPVLFTFGGSPGGWAVVDEEGRAVPLHQTFAYGKPLLVTFRLEPGYATEIQCLSTRMGASTKAGHGADTAIQAKPGTTCRVRWTLRLAETTRMENGKRVPVAGAWHGTLTTGEVRFRIVEAGSSSRHGR